MKNETVESLLLEALTFLETNKRVHAYCDDSFYSCPKQEEGCADENQGTECNCGAEEYNAKLEVLCDKIRKHISY